MNVIKEIFKQYSPFGLVILKRPSEERMEELYSTTPGLGSC
jgi:hypothetical protein